MLVYASDRAVSFKAEDVPSELKKFVSKDNSYFADELERNGSSKSNSPSKRKARGSDEGDLAKRGSHRSSSPVPNSSAESDDHTMHDGKSILI